MEPASPEDMTVARLKRMDYPTLRNFVLTNQATFTDEEWFLKTGWTRGETLSTILEELSEIMKGLN